MTGLGADFRDECEELQAFIRDLPEDDWRKPTIFHNWTIYDEIQHLYFLDHIGLMSLSAPADFDVFLKDYREKRAAGMQVSDYTRIYCPKFSVQELLSTWVACYRELADAFDRSDATARMKWFGPDMGIATFAQARLMEVWAHGQDIYDLLQVKRAATPRLKGICELGVRTFKWSFSVHGEEVPLERPYVVLTGPEAEIWTWGDRQNELAVKGSAYDFCLIVTQRRHIDDTSLETVGPKARRWMEIAQCFAGEPAYGPPAGVRNINY